MNLESLMSVWRLARLFCLGAQLKNVSAQGVQRILTLAEFAYSYKF